MRLKFTARGRAALVNAAHTGTNAVTVTQIGVTDRAFTPDPAGGNTTLPGERKRLATFGGKAVADDVVHLTLRDESQDTYQLRGIGLYLQDGTLLAVYGGDAVILEKSSQAMMMLAVDWLLADTDAHTIQFGNVDFLNPPATTETQGVVELATDEEGIGGSDRHRAMTAAADKAALDARLGSAAPTGLTKRLLGREKPEDVREDLDIKSAALKNEGHGNGLDADTLDGKHAADLASKTHTHKLSDITDLNASQLLPPGLVAHFPTTTPPEGWLRCNGADVSRTTYAALFAVVGLTFGSASGSTFRLPDLRGEFIRGWDDGRGVDPGRALGSLQQDEIREHSHLSPTASGRITSPGREVPGSSGSDGYDYADQYGSIPVKSTGGPETRPRNLSLLPCIKF